MSEGAAIGNMFLTASFRKRCQMLIPSTNSKSEGFVFSSYDFLEINEFDQWYLTQFNKRLSSKVMKNIGILHLPDQKAIFDTVEVVHQTFQILKDHKVLMNGKNLTNSIG
jgi:hypothetical protein